MVILQLCNNIKKLLNFKRKAKCRTVYNMNIVILNLYD